MNAYKLIGEFVFWYPAFMSIVWIMGSIIFHRKTEKFDCLKECGEKPMVSILIPCYNEEKTIEETMLHMNQLDYPTYEVIAIDDGSLDATFEVLSRMTLKMERLRIIHLKENCGKANALEIGFIAAKAEIIVCVDADAYLKEDAIHYLVEHFTEKQNGERVGAVTGNARIRNRSSLLAKIQLSEFSSIVGMIKRSQRILGKIMTVSGVVVAFRKRALLQCGLWDRDILTEDIGVTWKLEKNYWDVRFETRAVCWMLVPETIRGLWKQRMRWASGGIQVLMRHGDIFRDWRKRRIIPVYLEQVLSALWSYSWLGLTFYEAVLLALGSNTFFLYLFKSQFLSFLVLLQFYIALKFDQYYDEDLFRYYHFSIWYPLFYWMLSAIILICAVPKTLLQKKSTGLWESPDRGLQKGEKQ